MTTRWQTLLEQLAGPYVLGTLEARVRRGFEARMARSAALRAAVRDWQERLFPLAATATGPAPSAATWEALAGRVSGGSPSTAGPVDPAPSAPGSALDGLLRSMHAWWRATWHRVMSPALAGALLAVVIAAPLAVLIDRAWRDVGGSAGSAGGTVSVPAGRALPESYAGFLADASGRPALLVGSLRTGLVLDVKPIRPIARPAEQRAVLWALRPDGPPLRVGAIGVDGPSQLGLIDRADRLLATVNELAVSFESAAAPLPAAPTGAFVLRGPCARFW